MEYSNKISLANRSPETFDAGGLEYLRYRFEFLSTPLGGFSIDDGVDSFLNIFRGRISMDLIWAGARALKRYWWLVLEEFLTLERCDKDRCDEDRLMLPDRESLAAESISPLNNCRFFSESRNLGEGSCCSSASASASSSGSCSRFRLVPAG